jgi:hypothetical protein
MQTAQNIPGHIRICSAIIVSAQAENLINELEKQGVTFFKTGSGRVAMSYTGKVSKATLRKARQLWRRMEIPYFFEMSAEHMRYVYQNFNQRFS